MRETRLIVRDLRGTRFRTAAVIVSVAVLVSLIFSTSVFEVGSRKASQVGAEKFGADAMVLAPLTPLTFSYETATSPIFVVDRAQGYVNASLVRVLQGLPGVETASPQLFVGNVNGSTPGSADILVGFDPSSDFVIRAWYNGSTSGLADGQAIAGADAAVSPGDRVGFGGSTLQVIGVLRPTNSSLDRTVLVSIQTAYSLAPSGASGKASAVMVKVSADSSVTTVEAEVKYWVGNFRLVEASGLVNRVRVDTSGLASYELLAEITMGVSVFVLMGLVFSMTTNERGRQLGMMRSLGAERRFIFINVLKEAGILAVIGGLLGLVLGEAVVYFGKEFLVATFNTSLISPDFPDYLLLTLRSLILGVATGTAASVLPAYRVTKRDPYEAIRKGE